MENTIENKLKFFGQYFGQKIFYESEKWLVTVPLDSLRVSWAPSLVAELTPLSMISDEDAIEVSKMFESSAHKVKYTDYGNIGFSFYVGDEVESLEVSPEWDRLATDYLRSKGYALPFMGLSVEKQIEYGWVKIKTNNNGKKQKT